MRTNDLIKLLVHDAPIRTTLSQILAHAIVAAVLIAGICFYSALGFRHDIDSALHSYRFLYKLLMTITLAISAGNVLFRIGRPGVPLRFPSLGLLAPVALIAGAVVVEMAVKPVETWVPRMIGHNARFCLTIIPVLSLGPLACFLSALRRAAPERPDLAGAVVGLAAAGIAATFYAANCDDDSPLFVVLWYPIAISIVTGMGAVVGRKLLRW